MAFKPITVDDKENIYIDGKKILNAVDLVYEKTVGDVSEIHLVFVGNIDFQGFDIEE